MIFLMIGFDKTHLEDYNRLDLMVHFFLYDYRFERVWKNPDNDMEKLSRYRAVLSPDFSMYLEMAPVMQLYKQIMVEAISIQIHTTIESIGIILMNIQSRDPPSIILMVLPSSNNTGGCFLWEK